MSANPARRNALSKFAGDSFPSVAYSPKASTQREALPPEEVLSRDEVLSKAEPGRVSKTTMQEWEQEKNTKEQPLLADAAGRVISSSGSGHGSCFLLFLL
jgi:hypothetical protein